MKNIIINPKISYDKKRNETNDVIDQALINWLLSNSYKPIVISNSFSKLTANEIMKYFDSLNTRGIVLSGGGNIQKNSPRYTLEKLLIKYSIKKKIPLLGICHGMQMIGVYFGSKLKKIKNHVKKVHTLKNKTKEKYPKIVNSYHDLSLVSCPKDFVITTTSKDDCIESIKHKKVPIEGWMWHPEREKRIKSVHNLRLKKLFK